MLATDTLLETSKKLRPVDNSWVVEVLEADQLGLANAQRTKSYGRAELKRPVKLLLWAMRLYVGLAVLMILLQVYISLNQ